MSKPQISPRFPARAVKATPAQLRLQPRTDKTVPEGESRLPTQLPPPKRHAVDPDVQVTSPRGRDGKIGATDTAEGPDAMGAPVVNAPGILSNAFPPDTVGDIGRNHYIQMTNAPSGNGNTVFQIFDKAGNDLSGGPQRFGGLWPAGDPCNSDLGDPIVVYDHLADRWNLSQFARNVAQTQFWMCFAISQTPDPTAGTWFVYTIPVPVFPDYPKIGVWPDGYYMSSYEGNNLGVFVFDRNAMLTGSAAAFTKFTLPSLGTASVRDTRILPADLDGAAPPLGTPNFFVRPVDDQQDPGSNDRVEIYEFASNWTTNTFTFTPVATLTAPAIQPFDIMTCNRGGGGVRDCIPQPGTTSTVDALSNRPMMQLKYRNFGSREAMVFNQTIDVSGSVAALLGIAVPNEVAGIRWYELSRAGGAWGVGQQGTYAPQPIGADSEAELLHRWMGSAAMDKDGNIALGYSIANSDGTNQVFPGMRYAGRRFDDLAGQLGQTERVILNGANAETGGAGQRWGDYSAMSVDPVDDCTFYFTSHNATGAGGKPTRIAAFRFDGCGTDLRITKSDSPDPVAAGGLLRYDITVTNLGSTLSEDVSVLDTLPAGVTFQSATASCVLAAPTLDCALGDIAPGASINFSIQVQVSASAIVDGISTLTNTAEVSSATGDPNPGNNIAVASTQVIESADLRVLKTCKPDGVAAAGSPAHCEIQVDNLGPSDARNVSLVDVITSNAPFTVTAATVLPSGSCLPATPIGPTSSVTLTCDLLTVAAGTRKTVRVEFTSQGASDVNDTATVSSDTPDPDPSNNSATGRVSFAASANLAISKTSAPNPVVAGTNLVYTLSVSNNGPSAATNVVVKDALPAHVSIVTANASQGTCNGGIPGSPLLPMICTLGTLANGANATITLTVLVSPSAPDGTILVNNATVESAAGDPDNADNSATALTTVQAHADMSVVKTSDKPVYKPSSLIAYTITVRNNGTSDAKAVAVTDNLPDIRQALYQSDTGGCTKSGNTLTCQLGDMPLGTTRSFNVYVVVKGSRGDVSNTATVVSATTDPNLANNTSVRVVKIGK
ncbi:MAG TPA: DUF11 domain-containing protein [Lysobacter sp.]